MYQPYYENIKNDDFWKRGEYYTSENNNENLYNVRVSIINNQIRFFFIGIKLPLDPNNAIANIYELDQNKEIHHIDSFNLFPSKSEEDIIHKDVHIHEFMLLQLDNLIIRNGRLYYHKVLEYSESYYGFTSKKKDFYEYIIGSKKMQVKLTMKFIRIL